jgi:hypothetical protein
MTKVISIHEIELRPGITTEEFERFLTAEYLPGVAPMPPGWSVTYLKGDRAERAGKFAVLFEVDSVEMRDRFFPSSGEPSAELQHQHRLRTAAQAALEDKMHTLAAEIGEIFTDYTVIAG